MTMATWVEREFHIRVLRMTPPMTHIAIRDLISISVHKDDLVAMFPLTLLDERLGIEFMYTKGTEGFYIMRDTSSYSQSRLFTTQNIKHNFKLLTPTDLLGLKFNI